MSLEECSVVRKTGDKEQGTHSGNKSLSNKVSKCPRSLSPVLVSCVRSDDDTTRHYKRTLLVGGGGGEGGGEVETEEEEEKERPVDTPDTPAVHGSAVRWLPAKTGEPKVQPRVQPDKLMEPAGPEERHSLGGVRGILLLRRGTSQQFSNNLPHPISFKQSTTYRGISKYSYKAFPWLN